MKFSESFLDINGLVLPQPKTSDKPADNGVMFLSVAVILGFDFPKYKELVRSCYLKPGLIARWPGNNFDQAAWDDLLALAVACIHLGITDIPREILSYGIKHFFVFDTDNKLEGRDFLLRNFPIWPMMICAAFPIVRILMKPLLYITQHFFNKPDLNDTSSIQLQWLFLYGCKLSGHEFPKLKEHEDIRKEAFSIYYHKDHPFNSL